MSLFAKGKVLRQNEVDATIELTEDELGRALLSYIINSADRGVGEKFIQGFLSGKPMTINELLISNADATKKNAKLDNEVCNESVSVKREINETNISVENKEDTEVKCTEVKETELNLVNIEENIVVNKEQPIEVKNDDNIEENISVAEESYLSAEKISNVSKSTNVRELSDNEIINTLINKDSIQERFLDLKDKCQNVYERITKTKNGINSQIMANCDIILRFEDKNVVYSFVMNKGGKSNVITPNNNTVFAWNEANREELEELYSLL